MEKNIFSDPELNEDIAICLHKMTNDNKSFAALRKARANAFICQYMADPGWACECKEDDMKSAADLLFPEWLKTVDVRDYLVKSKLSDDLLEDMSANELKTVLADEMRIYYDAFRENAARSASDEKENSDYDGDFSEKFKSDKEFIKMVDELLNRQHKEDDEDEEEENADGNNEDEDSDDSSDEDDDNDDDDGGEEGENDEVLEKAIDAIVKCLGKFYEISERLNKTERKKKE